MVLEGAYGPNCIMAQLVPLGPQFTHLKGNMHCPYNLGTLSGYTLLYSTNGQVDKYCIIWIASQGHLGDELAH